jgi:hypothetical protein
LIKISQTVVQLWHSSQTVVQLWHSSQTVMQLWHSSQTVVQLWHSRKIPLFTDLKKRNIYGKRARVSLFSTNSVLDILPPIIIERLTVTTRAETFVDLRAKCLSELSDFNRH